MSGDRMSSAERAIHYDVHHKSMVAAYAMWFFIGYTGAHRFYLGRRISAAIMLALWAVGFLIVVIAVVTDAPSPYGNIPADQVMRLIVQLGVALVVFVAAGIWHLVDAFLIPAMVESANEELAWRIRNTPASKRFHIR